MVLPAKIDENGVLKSRSVFYHPENQEGNTDIKIEDLEIDD